MVQIYHEKIRRSGHVLPDDVVLPGPFLVCFRCQNETVVLQCFIVRTKYSDRVKSLLRVTYLFLVEKYKSYALRYRKMNTNRNVSC